MQRCDSQSEEAEYQGDGRLENPADPAGGESFSVGSAVKHDNAGGDKWVSSEAALGNDEGDGAKYQYCEGRARADILQIG